MIEYQKGCIPSETREDNELEANAAAFAYNKNYNIMYVPSTSGDDSGSGGQNLCNKDPGSDANESFRDLIKALFGGDDKEVKTESETVGKASIENTNLNFIVNISS